MTENDRSFLELQAFAFVKRTWCIKDDRPNDRP